MNADFARLHLSRVAITRIPAPILWNAGLIQNKLTQVSLLTTFLRIPGGIMHVAFSLLKYGQAYSWAKTEIYKTRTSRSDDLSNTIAPAEKGLLCCKAAEVQRKILCYKLRTAHSLQSGSQVGWLGSIEGKSIRKFFQRYDQNEEVIHSSLFPTFFTPTTTTQIPHPIPSLWQGSMGGYPSCMEWNRAADSTEMYRHLEIVAGCLLSRSLNNTAPITDSVWKDATWYWYWLRSLQLTLEFVLP